MRISHKYKFVFIAIPKTGSTTIRKVLDQYSDVISVGDRNSPYIHHTSAYKLKKHFEEVGWNWDEYFKFAFVRNPWDRLVSSFNYQKKVVHEKEKYGIDNPNYEDYKRFTKDNNFSSWMNPPLKMGPNFKALVDESNNFLMDFIGKFENLQEDFNTICDKIEIPQQKLPHKNKTNHKHYTEYYDEETRQLVAKKFAKDIEYFGYEFGVT